MPTSRGDDIRNYNPAFKKGAMITFSGNISASTIKRSHISAGVVTAAKLRYALVTGTITADSTIQAVAHGLAATPTVAIVFPRSTGTKINGTTSANVGLSSVSASTSASIYIHGQAGAGFAAFVLL